MVLQSQMNEIHNLKYISIKKNNQWGHLHTVRALCPSPAVQLCSPTSVASQLCSWAWRCLPQPGQGTPGEPCQEEGSSEAWVRAGAPCHKPVLSDGCWRLWGRWGQRTPQPAQAHCKAAFHNSHGEATNAQAASANTYPKALTAQWNDVIWDIKMKSLKMNLNV